MNSQITAVELVKDTTKQLITLSTAFITVTLTFSEQIFEKAETWQGNVFVLGWMVFVASTAIGFWVLLAITGSLAENSDNSGALNIYRSNIRLPAFLHLITFLLGMLLVGCWGIGKISW